LSISIVAESQGAALAHALVVGLNDPQILVEESVHGAVLRVLLVSEQGVHILDQGTLDGAVPRLGEPTRHGGHGLPVLFDVRDDLLVLAELDLATSFPGSRLLHIGNGAVAHLGYG